MCWHMRMHVISAYAYERKKYILLLLGGQYDFIHAWSSSFFIHLFLFVRRFIQYGSFRGEGDYNFHSVSTFLWFSLNFHLFFYHYFDYRIWLFLSLFCSYLCYSFTLCINKIAQFLNICFCYYSVLAYSFRFSFRIFILFLRFRLCWNFRSALI